MCQSDFITLNRSTTSRSGLYASDLPGVENELIELISKDSESDGEVWERVYGNAWANMVSDVRNALQSKFFVNAKLVSRETSKFSEDSNLYSGIAGIKIQFDLPRYARLHVVSIEVKSVNDYASPGINLQFFDTDQSGEVLFEKEQALTEGRNTIFIDQDFSVDKLFIGFDASLIELLKTSNKYYDGFRWLSDNECQYQCFGGDAYVAQINGGGLNVVFNIYCSEEKFVCQNINLFSRVLWWKIGQELIIERRYGNRLNEFTTMNQERAEELTDFYQAQYSQALNNAIESHNITEDPICFECKGSVNVKTNLP